MSHKAQRCTSKLTSDAGATAVRQRVGNLVEAPESSIPLKLHERVRGEFTDEQCTIAHEEAHATPICPEFDESHGRGKALRATGREDDVCGVSANEHEDEVDDAVAREIFVHPIRHVLRVQALMRREPGTATIGSRRRAPPGGGGYGVRDDAIGGRCGI